MPSCRDQRTLWPPGTGLKAPAARVSGPPPQETASRGSKCKCYCGVEPCGAGGGRWDPQTGTQTTDAVQALASRLQEFLNHRDIKRLHSHSAKLSSQLKKLEKRLERNVPSVGSLLTDTFASIVQHQVTYHNFSITVASMRKDMNRLAQLLQKHVPQPLEDSTKIPLKTQQMKPPSPPGESSTLAGHKQQVDPQTMAGEKSVRMPPAPAPMGPSLNVVARRPPDNTRNMIQQDVCDGTPVMISEPTTHSMYGRAEGAWMKDPINNQERVYVANYFFGTKLMEFRSLDHFKRGRWLHCYKLPYSWTGTGHAVYNGSFYYNQAYTHNIIRYDLAKRAVASWGLLDDLTIGSMALAGWKGYSEVDFLADEGGLWVTYFSDDFGYLHEEVLVLSRLDPVDLTIRQETTWKTRLHRASYGRSFLICGVFYAMDRQRQGDGIVTYAFDTHTGFQSNPGLSIQIQYNLLTQLDYNPTDRLLYAWDNGHQVTYNIRFAN
ncbi:olfactomedin-like protein 2B [Leucoraja erinacea]|uniref:olfactomedin-like protein 2B n=1 Tax=Leucoraja erinaceus TaxID=7782 RepID=UPI00245463BF|nr:olfactomedin-like protein 2B [Leucoraja erinacea]